RLPESMEILRMTPGHIKHVYGVSFEGTLRLMWIINNVIPIPEYVMREYPPKRDEQYESVMKTVKNKRIASEWIMRQEKELPIPRFLPHVIESCLFRAPSIVTRDIVIEAMCALL